MHILNVKRFFHNLFSKKNLSNLFFSFESFPIILSLALLALLFVLVRMRGIEQDYKFNDLTQQISRAMYENRDLKARRAKLLSAKNLRVMATKFNMEGPKQNQIIIIP